MASIDQTTPEGLTAPSLTALLACRGELPSIAATVCGTAAGLDADAVYVLAEWGLAEFCAGPDAWEFAYTCALFGVCPSRYLGLTDPVLGFSLDRACAALLQPERGSGQRSEEAVRFTTGGPA